MQWRTSQRIKAGIAFVHSQRATLVLWTVVGLSAPLSVKLYLPGIGTEVIFPAEPLVAFASAWMILQLATQGHIPWAMLRRPVALLGMAWLLIHAFAAGMSHLPLVSWKAAIVQAIYVSTFLLLPLLTGQVQRLFGTAGKYDLAFLLVAGWTVMNQSLTGFDRSGANYASFPFYIDHTIFSAALTFVLIRQFTRTHGVIIDGGPISRKVLMVLLTVAYMLLLLISFSRGAWVGVLVALSVALLFRVGVSWKYPAVAALIGGSILFIERAPLLERMQGHGVVSQEPGAGPVATARSTLNVTTDASNRDRLLRWAAAWRMFLAEPWSGHGPGSYQFVHEDHLTASERARSHSMGVVPDHRTKPAWRLGDSIWMRDTAEASPSSGGSAHSEYLLSLSENGLLGGLWWLLVVVLILRSAQRLFALHPKGLPWGAHHAAAIAIMAYLVHGLFNNFLDDVKIAHLFWPALLGILEGHQREMP
jgi:putative inorganic carbon (HCO3(-)) transporter